MVRRESDQIEPGEITRLLNDSQNPEGLNEVISLVYQDLRGIAASYLKSTPNRTLQPTALVHQAYEELLGKKMGTFQNREHFFAYATRVMRHLLYKYVRDMNRIKRGGDQVRITLDDALAQNGLNPESLLSLEHAMERLKKKDPSLHHLVELRSFLGLTIGEIAEVTQQAQRTVERNWQFCRTWLAREMKS